MIKALRYIAILLVVGCFLLSAQNVYAQAAVLTTEQLTEISKRCTSVQINLDQLQKRDAVSRINRGRVYDQIMNQVSALNSRFAFNKLNAPDLLPISSELQSHIDQFRSISDKAYLEHVINAVKIDCKTKPAEFYSLIVQAREDRQKVVEQIVKIDELLAKYRAALLTYQTTITPENP